MTDANQESPCGCVGVLWGKPGHVESCRHHPSWLRRAIQEQFEIGNKNRKLLLAALDLLEAALPMADKWADGDRLDRDTLDAAVAKAEGAGLMRDRHQNFQDPEQKSSNDSGQVDPESGGAGKGI
jgi:hypothetical protein